MYICHNCFLAQRSCGTLSPFLVLLLEKWFWGYGDYSREKEIGPKVRSRKGQGVSYFPRVRHFALQIIQPFAFDSNKPEQRAKSR